MQLIVILIEGIFFLEPYRGRFRVDAGTAISPALLCNPLHFQDRLQDLTEVSKLRRRMLFRAKVCHREEYHNSLGPKESSEWGLDTRQDLHFQYLMEEQIH